MDEALAARRGSARPKRAQPQRRLRDRLVAPAGSSAEARRRRAGGPHAEAVALEQAGKRAAGRHGLRHAGTLRASKPARPRLHRSPARGETRARRDCAQGSRPPDVRKRNQRLRRAGIEVTLGRWPEAAKRSLAGWLTRLKLGRPRITLKLALSIDGKIALPSGESKWITGEDARRHVHLERAHSDMILVGRGTYLADQPRLDVRLPGLEQRLAAPRAADSRRSGRRLGNPAKSAGCVSTS